MGAFEVIIKNGFITHIFMVAVSRTFSSVSSNKERKEIKKFSTKVDELCSKLSQFFRKQHDSKERTDPKTARLLPAW